MNGCHLHPSAPRGDQSEDKAPICPLLQREFWLPGSQLSGAQAATAGFVLLTMQSDTPRVCLSLEKCLSVLELWRRWTQGCFHECCGFIHIFKGNLPWDVVGMHLKEPGVHVPVDEGISSLP